MKEYIVYAHYGPNLILNSFDDENEAIDYLFLVCEETGSFRIFYATREEWDSGLL